MAESVRWPVGTRLRIMQAALPEWRGMEVITCQPADDIPRTQRIWVRAALDFHRPDGLSTPFVWDPDELEVVLVPPPLNDRKKLEHWLSS